jgi:hypothetical protein
MKKYELVDYFDVWGNCWDGYVINDQRIVGIVELPDNPTDQDFLDAAIDAGILRDSVTLADIVVEEYGNNTEILDTNPKEPFDQEKDIEEIDKGKDPLPLCAFCPVD